MANHGFIDHPDYLQPEPTRENPPLRQTTPDSTGLLELAHSLAAGGSHAFSGTIAGLAFDGTHSDTLDLQDINFASGANWSFQENANGNRGMLTVTDSMGDTAKVTLLGQYLAAGATANSGNSNLFGLAADQTSGTLVTTTFHG